jgi:phytoene dehydrogenase-like protein
MGYESDQADVIVVGGGLAGLTAAALLARAGHAVVVLERASEPGGRAVTHLRQGVRFNLGPHALYRRGHAFRLLRALGVPFSGRSPDAGRGLLFAGDTPHLLTAGLAILLATRLLTLREKWRLVCLLVTLPRLDARPYDRLALGDWVERTAGSGRLAGLLETLFRVSTYADEPGRLSAGAALDQLKLALAGNVWYLDGGWQTLVDGLRDRAVRSGAGLRTGARAGSVQVDGEGVCVRLAGGEALRGRAAVLAVGPEEACRLLELPGDAPLVRWAAGRIPVRAACLDVALDRLPRPEHLVAFDMDRPLYYSVHSAVARLAPEGVAVVHVAKYLAGGAAADEDELEEFLDRLQPGWTAHVVDRRFLPGMTVAHALPRAEEGGLAGRPGVKVDGRPGVFLAGDWVGARGMLADASAASAEEAACGVQEVLGRSADRPARRTAHVGA